MMAFSPLREEQSQGPNGPSEAREPFTLGRAVLRSIIILLSAMRGVFEFLAGLGLKIFSPFPKGRNEDLTGLSRGVSARIDLRMLFLAPTY